MRILSIVLAASLAGVLVSCSSQNGSTTSQEPAEKNLTEASGAPVETNAGLYGLAAQTLEGEPVNLSAYAGKVTLVVNVASKCGYTGQYAGLQALHAELEDQGFAVLGFPSNEFGGQEPGSAQDIRSFCTERFDVSFPMFAKCDVKPGDSQSPIFAFLEQQSGQVPGWNFCKYLVGPDGQVIQFYASGVAPDADELRKAIETALG
tara:strand:- start:3967 stop:4581 length:615 start_codon:yes stop_codon:yes gene_type:complete